MDRETADRTMQLIDRAIHNGKLVVIELKERATGKPVAVLAELWTDDKGNAAIAPLARLFDGNPNDEIVGPQDGVSVYAKTGAEALDKAFGPTASNPV